MVQYAHDQIGLAEQLMQLKIADLPLAEHRDQLVKLYRQDAQLRLTETEFMEPDGSVLLTSASVRERYDQISQQRIANSREAQTKASAIRLYCATQ